jgi:hypothetical protein
MKRPHLLVFANFLAAIGGGIILSAGIGAFKETFLRGSILAFFAGAVIGLMLLRLVPQRWARSQSPWFSIGISILSIILFQLNPESPGPRGLTGVAGVLFTVILSVRFGLWFFARALRAQTVGGEKQGIALIELGYYTGVAAGLFVWSNSGHGTLNPLLIDAVLQAAAGLIDFTASRGCQSNENMPPVPHTRGRVPQQDTIANQASGSLPSSTGWYWRLAVAVTSLTVGFQAVPFSLSGMDVQGWRPYVMGTFYTGVALSALACRILKIRVCCIEPRWLVGNAIISSERRSIGLSFSFALITLMAAASMVAALSVIGLWRWHLVLTLIAVSAFTYQILVLSLLDYIARTERLIGLDEMVMRTYLIAAVVTIVSLWVLDRFPESYVGRAALTLVCSALSVSVTRKIADVRA